MPRTAFDALEGAESVHIGNSVLNGGVEQSFATDIGNQYQVRFWGINWSERGTGNGTVRVYNDSGDDLNEVWSAADPDGGGWTESVFNFVASDTTSTLEIRNGDVDALTVDVASVMAEPKNLLTDGSFEVGAVVAGGFQQLQPGDTFGAWTVVGEANGTGIIGLPYGALFALEDVEAVHIGNSVFAGGVEQSFATSIGAEYQVSVWGLNWPGMGAGTGTLRVYHAGGDNLNEEWTAADDAWTEASFSFVASDWTSTLEIKNVGGSALTIDMAAAELTGVIACVDATFDAGQVSEKNSTSDSLVIVLPNEPTDTVTVTVDPATDDVSLDAEGPNDAVTVTFGTDDWDTPQTVIVTANDDAEVEGTEDVVINVSTASTDGRFNCTVQVTVTVLDNDVPGVSVAETGGSTDVFEGGADDNYTVEILMAPTDTVTVTLDDTGEPNQVTLNGSQVPVVLTFTLANWQTPQTVTVEAINDDDAEAHPHATTLTHTAASGDANYEGIAINDVDVSIGEDDCGAGPFDPEDFDQNCIVNVLDFAIFTGRFLTCSLALCP